MSFTRSTLSVAEYSFGWGARDLKPFRRLINAHQSIHSSHAMSQFGLANAWPVYSSEGSTPWRGFLGNIASIIIDRQYTSPDRWMVSYHIFDSACRIGIYQQISSTDYLPSLCNRAVQAALAWTILGSLSATLDNTALIIIRRPYTSLHRWMLSTDHLD